VLDRVSLALASPYGLRELFKLFEPQPIGSSQEAETLILAAPPAELSITHVAAHFSAAHLPPRQSANQLLRLII